MLEPVETTPKEPLPELNFKNLCKDAVNGLYAAVFSPVAANFAAVFVVIFEAVALKLIIASVKYTEIDFTTYMQQIKLINEGELNYKNIFGDTGDLVYPGGHVQVYQFLSWASQGGEDFSILQDLFRYLYLGTLMATLLVYYFCIGEGNLKPWVFYLLALSKRLHSIYVLRLFNDCFATLAAVGSILILALSSYWKTTSSLASYLMTILAADLYSLSISVKMNSLLYLPGFLLVLYLLCDENLLKMIPPLIVAVFVQWMTGFKFLPLDSSPEASEIRNAYLEQAFNFKRKFLYEWTVNWKFLSKETFMDDDFHKLLLSLHIVVLSLFMISKLITTNTMGKNLFKTAIDGLKFWKSTLLPTSIINSHINGPRFIFVAMAVSNLIGILFARSLHYQFLSWYAYSLPGLLVLNKFPAVFNIFLFAANEYSWNTYPSTPISSLILIGVLSIVILGVWTNNDLFTTEELGHDQETDDKKQD